MYQAWLGIALAPAVQNAVGGSKHARPWLGYPSSRAFETEGFGFRNDSAIAVDSALYGGVRAGAPTSRCLVLVRCSGARLGWGCCRPRACQMLTFCAQVGNDNNRIDHNSQQPTITTAATKNNNQQQAAATTTSSGGKESKNNPARFFVPEAQKIK